MSTLKKNIIANYASQLYVTGVGILILPLYIKYMGAEAYGLVGFFAMLQAWFILLDLGLTPTISRETARYKGGSMSALAFRRLLRALSMIFFSIAAIGGSVLLLSSELIASNWLTVEQLSLEEVTFSVQVMSLSVALRWLCGLYRGVITGSEKLVWLSAFNVIIATLRFVAVFGSMWLYGFKPTVFFVHQVIVALVELVGVWLMAQKLTPKINKLQEAIGWSFKPVAPLLKFSLTIAFTSSVWVLVTQTDKLILSGILPLVEYGYFTLAVLVASGIMVISGPVSSAIMPRMARLHAENKNDELLKVYRNSTQLVSIVAGSAAIVIAVCAEPLLYLWTANKELVENSAPILQLYAIGNGMLALSAFPYYLQYALGNLRYHLIGNALMVLILIPLVIYAAKQFGGVGAGWVWLSVNLFYLILWASFVHSKLAKKLVYSWLVTDVLLILLPTAIVTSIFSSTLIDNKLSVLMQVIQIILVAIVSLFVSIVCSNGIRAQFVRKFKAVK
ncbi:oligosaccharide flippase family protein [Pseudoalteromonas maricaloris]|uniref:oligosaccharide flippase family protein n=1 Tax=Pseudoalteromonas maricaloris TaxID=184924 RepID=UPI00029AAB52|nr:oligosaccharide flippase family protein [Pseudoalteromonas flavipulchra]